jgi:hypothetical protein
MLSARPEFVDQLVDGLVVVTEVDAYLDAFPHSVDRRKHAGLPEVGAEHRLIDPRGIDVRMSWPQSSS